MLAKAITTDVIIIGTITFVNSTIFSVKVFDVIFEFFNNFAKYTNCKIIINPIDTSPATETVIFTYLIINNKEEINPKIVNPDNIQYRMRYVKKPLPILLEDFSTSGLSIEGHNGNPDDDTDADADGGIFCKLPSFHLLQVL